ncbi:MAG TPA: ATP-binding protein [Beijerinckiaceae bacterium]|jgi:two-component system NtrC family sensor kinase
MQSRDSASAIRFLRLLIAASLVVPLTLFGYASFTSHRAAWAGADERIERTLDVLQEHALKVFETVELMIDTTDEVLRGFSDDEIRAGEARFHARLKQLHDGLPEIGAVLVFDRDGRLLISTADLPAPRTVDFSDRDYFKVHVAGGTGNYIGEVLIPRVSTTYFFNVSRRRTAPDGGFGGVTAVSVLPREIKAFYARLGKGLALSASLIRADGTFLARYPSPDERPLRLRPDSVFGRAIEAEPEAGIFTAASQIDGTERRIGYRKLAAYPVYVQAGLETAAVRGEWLATLASHLVFGVPATVLLFMISLLALRRTARFYAEAERREAAEAALKQSQRLEAMGQLTGGVAHDFNNLLMVIGGHVERLARQLPDPQHKRSLDAIAMAARRGENLTRQLLSFSRRQTHEPVVLDLAQRLPKLRHMLESSLRGDIQVALDIQRGIWPIAVDPGEFELALLNIAVNARDAMPGGGMLTIAARNVAVGDEDAIGIAGAFVALTVRDTGSGIAPDVLPRVFEPFFTTKEVGKGTGLGLSQVYGFATQSGGTATAASAVGSGTTVTLYLPRAAKGAGVRDARPPEAAPEGGDGGNVLLVEDHAEVAEVARECLEELGWRVTSVSRASAALELIEAGQRFDLVFSDVVMPGGMSGLDLAHRLRDIRPDLPVLLATGYSHAVQEGAGEAFTILPKPYTAAKIAAAIRGLSERLGSKDAARLTKAGE